MVKAALERNMTKQISHVSQLAKIHWIQMGEETSSMFFRRCRVRKLQSTLLRLIDEEGTVLEDMGLIRDHVVSFYAGLLGTQMGVVDHPIPESLVPCSG